MRWRIRGVAVEGHVEWHMWDQSWWSEEREESSGVAHPTAAKLHPSRRGRMWARITSSGRRENAVVRVVVVVVDMGGEEDMVCVCVCLCCCLKMGEFFLGRKFL